jgi:serine/threonine protein kinase
MIFPKINDYTLVRVIGNGGFGVVYLVHSIDKDEYALKLIPVTKETKVDAKK